ncbi:MAG: bifunctional 2-C-methyl-D-erythritol 4-phosphate cytidylyltransferase/2-C-methyl-D-erythritol 2,4-cyclodiphosphate synthase [Paracoccaceae bacterium]|nr:bifunctional 2-C-methyl-D-erythritol 4-phosphate cytidylyltransferase/2-C-methyl-D-erythritol 2,4-cyclodiphosphate synthase [Paracoccaceae bacterium]
MTIAALIVAAGRGLRAGGGLPKQYRTLKGIPVLARAIRALAAHPDIAEITVVLHPDDEARFEAIIAPHVDGIPLATCHGGKERSDSVAAGLESISGQGADHVLIHDAARPLVDLALISRVIDAMRETGAAAPAMPVTDTLWQGTGGTVSGVVPRERLFRAQTPQGFRLDLIRQAHQMLKDAATDDVSAARAAGHEVTIVEGSARNIKITGPDDFALAENLLGKEMDIRTGNGFDVHAFTEGDHVTLCGVRIAHGRALSGHSDADVAMHAVTDALYGALGAGDIGRWFPPTEAQWKGAASDIFLRHAVEMVTERGFAISNIDCTIICETPKIGPHAQAMRANLAQITGIDADRISVKATTSERLGFTGRKEGIAALATATLVKT